MNVDACMKVMRMPVAARRYGVGSSASAVPAIPAAVAAAIWPPAMALSRPLPDR